MLVHIDHITEAELAQVWVKCEEGSLFPILFNQEKFINFFHTWMKAGMPKKMNYTPEASTVSFSDQREPGDASHLL